MAMYIRDNPDGSKRVLSDEEAAAEDETSFRCRSKLISAVACAVLSGYATTWALGGLDTPLKKGAVVAAVLAGLIAGWRLAFLILVVFLGLLGLGLLGIIVLFVSWWVFH